MTLPLRAVVVHPDGALVHRAGQVRVTAGVVVVAGLPLLLDPSSVRLAVVGGGVGEVRVELDVLAAERGPEPELVAEVREREERRAVLAAELEGLRHERAALRRVAPAFDGADAERRLPEANRLARWAALDERLDRELAAVDRRVRELAREAEGQDEALALARRRLQDASTEERWRRWAPTRRVVARVAAAEEVEVALSYRVSGATWTPSYVLDADAALSRGRFSLRAQVAQATGEDWTGVALTLTTAPSGRRVDVPELPALRLGTRQAPPPSAWRDLPPGLDALFPELGGAASPRPAPPPVPEPAPASPAEFGAADELDLGGGAPGAPPFQAETFRAQAMPQPARKSAGLSNAARALFAGVPSGGAAAPPTRHRRAADRAEEPVAEVVEIGDLLDYGALRLAGFDAEPGRRGRLQPSTEDQRLVEASAPAAARDRLRQCLSVALQGADLAAARALNPRHTLPGPVQGSEVSARAEGLVDVPSDGRFHSVAVRSWDASLSVSYRAVPRHDPRAFRRVEATIDHVGALLPGPVDVYVDGRLELTVPWAGTPGRGRLRLGLGAEDRLKVVRNVRYREETAGLFGNGRRLHTTVEVAVASSLQRAVKVELLERLPVPGDAKELTVEQTEASPVAREYAGEPDGPILVGGRVQVVELAPGGEARAVLSYAVTLGGKDELVGGDRRG